MFTPLALVQVWEILLAYALGLFLPRALGLKLGSNKSWMPSSQTSFSVVAGLFLILKRAPRYLDFSRPRAWLGAAEALLALSFCLQPVFCLRQAQLAIVLRWCFNKPVRGEITHVHLKCNVIKGLGGVAFIKGWGGASPACLGTPLLALWLPAWPRAPEGQREAQAARGYCLLLANQCRGGRAAAPLMPVPATAAKSFITRRHRLRLQPNVAWR